MIKTILLCLLTFLISLVSLAQQYGWTDISDNIPENADLSDVFCVSDDEGWISVSSEAIILHTTNGGATLEIQTNQFSTSLAAIYIKGENEDFVGYGSGFAYRTADGGVNRSFHESLPSFFRNIDFTPETQGYACRNSGEVYSISGSITNLNSGKPTDFSGIYFCRLISEHKSMTQKLIIQK